MKKPSILAMWAAVVCSALLVVGFISYRMGSFRQLLQSETELTRDNAVEESPIARGRNSEDGDSSPQLADAFPIWTNLKSPAPDPRPTLKFELTPSPSSIAQMETGSSDLPSDWEEHVPSAAAAMEGRDSSPIERRTAKAGLLPVQPVVIHRYTVHSLQDPTFDGTPSKTLFSSEVPSLFGASGWVTEFMDPDSPSAHSTSFVAIVENDRAS